MSPRYLLAVGSGDKDRDDVLRLLMDRTGLSLSFSNERIAALVSPSCRCIGLATDGCIVGYLFPRHGPAREAANPGTEELRTILGSRGRTLLGSYWGGYVAALGNPGCVTVMRDPSGCFPCYFSTCADFVLFASDADLLVACTGRASIDAEEIGRQLYRAFIPTPATAICNVRELLAGFELRLPGSLHRQTPVWSPWDHAVDRGADPPETAERLSRTVRHCVHGWASCSNRILLSVSGGLDSSIVAACLARARENAVCLTMFTDDPAGDERLFARALCTRLGLSLIERPYRLSDIDIAEPLGAHLPRPRDRTQANAYERVHCAVASEIGAGAFMTGNGGDHIFGYSQSAAPIADRYLTDGLGLGMFDTLLDVCRQTGCSMADALRQAWRLARNAPTYQVRPNPLFLERQFVAGLGGQDLRHPWLDAPPDALPGKAAHIATILRIQPNLEPSSPDLPLFNPLVSQPVVEACLAIPTWDWRAGGRDRSVARRAFASDLPRLILERRVKGTPGRFAAALLDHFRQSIRERLLGGRLAAHRIVDSTAVERVLAGERPVDDLQRVRILELVSAEAWIDHWAARDRTPRTAGADFTAAGRGPLPPSADPIP